jgi:hypothetical protein
MATQRIFANHRLHALGKTIEPTSHVRSVGRKPGPRPAAPSNSRRFGRPITTPAPTQIEAGAGVPRQTPALPSSSSRGDDEARSPPIASMLSPVLAELPPRQRQMMLFRIHPSKATLFTDLIAC